MQSETFKVENISVLKEIFKNIVIYAEVVTL